MKGKTDARERPLKVEVVVPGLIKKDEMPPMRVYLFNRSAQLVASEPVKNGTAIIPIHEDQRYRLKIGPDFIKEGMVHPDKILSQLKNANAFTQDVPLRFAEERIRFNIPGPVIDCWWKQCIIIHGSVRKRINPGSDDPRFLPLCQGTVKIYTVSLTCLFERIDPSRIRILRDLVVDHLRGYKLQEEKVRLLHVPVPPGPLVTGEEVSGTIAFAAGAEKTPAVKGAVPVQAAFSDNNAFTETIAHTAAEISHADLASRLAIAEGIAIKDIFVAHKPILMPILCMILPDWWFCLHKVGEAAIQSDGSFSTEICFWCPADFPDLYFRVYQNIDGVDTCICSPRISCSTYHRYNGSAAVLITVVDQRAITCTGQGPNIQQEFYVEVLGITDKDLALINGYNTPYIAGTGLQNTGAPFGGTIGFNMTFHKDMGKPDALGNVPFYYRWKYRFDGDSDFTPIGTQVTHQYQLLSAGFPFPRVPEKLGPFTVGTEDNLFKFPDLTDPTRGWISVDNWSDLFFGFMDTTCGLTDPADYNPKDNGGASSRKSGMCTLLLEIFDKDGKLVQCNNEFYGMRGDGNAAGDPAVVSKGPFTFLIHDGTTDSPAKSENITAHGRFIFRICVDNNSTDAMLGKAHIGAAYSDQCGFLRFVNLTDTVSVDYSARHPKGYLTWELKIYRASCGNPTVSTSGAGNSVSPTFDNLAGDLLKKPVPCTECLDGAAFSAALWCYGTATNGRHRLSQYDDYANIGFALLK